MARKAVIASGVVENVIEAGDDFTLAGKTLIASDTAQIGDTWDGSVFTPPAPPPEPVPEAVTPRQARLALLGAGLLDTVEATIAAGSRADQITWEFAVDVRRDYSMIANLGTALGLTSAQIDDLFRTAATL
jgi:hypothetical protein